MFHRRGVWMAVAAACVGIWGVAEPLRAQETPDKAVVRLVIDYGDGVEKHFTELAWREGMTVLDAMKAASRHKRGIQFETKGSGPNTLLVRIDDVANEGRGRNWLYRVNDKLADRSCAIYTLEVWDTVLWKFDKYQ